ncbi:MAG: hypothetical protein WCF16_12525 [Alphaproteobacteria bacterium]
MLRTAIKWYLVVVTVVALVYAGVAGVYAPLDHNPSEEFCDYGAVGSHAQDANYLNDSPCLIDWGNVGFYWGVGLALGFIAQSPAYLYLVVSHVVRRRKQDAVPRSVIPAVAKAYIAVLMVLAVVWYALTVYAMATENITMLSYLCDDGSTSCPAPRGAMIVNFSVSLAVALAIVQSPAWAYLYLRRRRIVAGPAF